MIQHNNQQFFLSWFNDFLSFLAMARAHNMTVEQVAMKVRKGRLIHESQFSNIVFDVCADFEPIKLQGIDCSLHNTQEEY